MLTSRLYVSVSLLIFGYQESSLISAFPLKCCFLKSTV